MYYLLDNKVDQLAKNQIRYIVIWKCDCKWDIKVIINIKSISCSSSQNK